jgi:hypothetical protein
MLQDGLDAGTHRRVTALLNEALEQLRAGQQERRSETPDGE